MLIRTVSGRFLKSKMVDLLIIGKSGQLGSALVNVASSKKLNFEAFSREELDIARQKHLARIVEIKPKIIINTSAYHVVSDCELHPLKAFQINSIAVSKLAKMANEINAKFVTFSTNYVFDGKKRTPYLEEEKTNPLQMYGLSKLAGEIAALNEYSNGTYIIRTSGVYGNKKTGSRSKGGNFVLKILREAKKKDAIFVSEQQIVNPTYAPDLALATINLLNTNAGPGVYHLANSGSCSWYEFAKDILWLKKIKTRIIPVKDDEEGGLKRPIYSVLGNYEAKKYGVVLPTINEGLARYLKEV